MTEWQKRRITTVTSEATLVQTLQQLGVQATDSCLVHTALSQLGYVPGGEQAVVGALKTVFKHGNLVMPAQTADYSDPQFWEMPPTTPAAASAIHAAMPGFDPELSPVHFIGKTPEYFRTLPGTKRSEHPLCSMCAWGPLASQICVTTTFDQPFGANGPLQKLYDLDAKIIFLGTDYETCTALHLAESTIGRPQFYSTAPLALEGGTQWVRFIDVPLDPYDDFTTVGLAFEAAHPEALQQKPLATSRIAVLQMRPLVDFARTYYRQKDQTQQELLRGIRAI